VGSGAGFTNVGALTLSTATGLKLGSGTFDVLSTTSLDAAGLTGTPVPGPAGLVTNPATLTSLGLGIKGNLVLQGGLLTVDSSLLLDSQDGEL